MKKIKLGTGFAVFLLFFGAALIDAIETRYWPRIIFWLVAGAVFVMSDNLKKVH